MVRVRRSDGEFPVIPPNMDFRPLSRNADKIATTITLYTDHERSEWIKLGEIQLRERDSHHFKGIWTLGAYLLNATDNEHDSAWLLKMELVGVEFTSVEYGQTHFQGFIRADMEEDFRVPPPDYAPFEGKDARTCKGTRKDYCKWADGKPHPIAKYIPDANVELFNIVRGRRVEVTTGPVRTPEDDEE